MTLPTGTVTFLLSDIEGSTKLPRRFRSEMPALLARYHSILPEAIGAGNGYVFWVTGDGLCAVFHTASDALLAAIDSQRGQEPGWQIPSCRGEPH